MQAHIKLNKILQMLSMLSWGQRYSVKEIAERRNLTERTVYRYLNTLRDAGFIINKTDYRYEIKKQDQNNKKISDLLHFSDEEAYILSKAIHAINENNVIKKQLVKKLYSLYDSYNITKTIFKKEHSESIHLLFKAIKEKKQVRLKNYASSHSDNTRDRLVEPFDFSINYIDVWCYEPESRKNKLFKTARIQSVEIQADSWQYKNHHKAGNLDIFRICSYEKIPVQMKMSMKAKNLLIEEHPLAEEYIKSMENNQYMFDGWVSSFDGIARFILGLIDEVEIIKPKKLKDYIREKIRKLFI